MKKTINITLILLTLFFYSCEKNLPPLPTELPPVTTRGKNTFGCMIENEIYVPDIRRMSFSVDIYFEFPQYPDYYFYVRTKRLVDENDEAMDAEVSFGIDSLRDTGIYNITGAGVLYSEKYYGTYQMTPEDIGTVEILRLDTVNKIISGKFNFIAIAEDSSIIHVSDGRFDLKNR